MRVYKTTFTIILLLLSFTFAFPQDTVSSVLINSTKEKVIVSGVVSDEAAKNYLIRAAKAKFGNAIDESKLKVDSSVKPFGENWKKEFDALLVNVKNGTFGLFIFKGISSNQFPTIAEGIMQVHILLSDSQTITKLSDYRNKIIVLSFIESWAGPARSFVLELNKIYDEYGSKNIELIAVSTESSDDEKAVFREFVTQNKIEFKTGWVNKNFYKSFAQISKFDGIPQAFVIKNGNIRAVFLGNSPKVKTKLRELIADLAK